MNKPLDLSALIRCLEVMADENSWEESILTNDRWLIDATEAPPWEVAKGALIIVRSILDNQNANVDEPHGHDRISNQELPPHES